MSLTSASGSGLIPVLTFFGGGDTGLVAVRGSALSISPSLEVCFDTVGVKAACSRGVDVDSEIRRPVNIGGSAASFEI